MKISISWGLLAIGLTLPLSCGPDPSGTVAVRVLAPNELGEYTLTTRNVKGVEAFANSEVSALISERTPRPPSVWRNERMTAVGPSH